MRRLVPAAAITLIGALAAGCAVGPDYQRPHLDAPAHFNQQAAHAARDPQAGDDAAAAALADWWQRFNDPVLTDDRRPGHWPTTSIWPRWRHESASRGRSRACRPLPCCRPARSAASRPRFHQSLRSQLGQILDASAPDFDRNGSYNELNLGASWELDLFGGRRRAREAAVAELQGC